MCSSLTSGLILQLGLHHWNLFLISIEERGGEGRCANPTESMQSQWIMRDVSASSPAVLYEVTRPLTSMGSLFPQKLNRDCRIWFHGVLWSTTAIDTERKKSGCISLAALLMCLLMILFAAALVYCIASLVYIFVSTFSSQFFFTYSFKAMKWGGRQVCSSPASLWVSLPGNAGGHELLGIQQGANLLPSCSIWVEEHCS